MSKVVRWLCVDALVWLVRLSWVIAINLVVYNSVLIYYTFATTDNWMRYYEVVPAKSVFRTDERVKFISHTDLLKDIPITFNDILYCRDDVGDFERYSTQTTNGAHNKLGLDRYTTWPYSPAPVTSTECCLDSYIQLHLPLHVDRNLFYSGCEKQLYFKIEEVKK